METCPGCGGRCVVVSLNTVMACGRCHGAGVINPIREIREALDRARADREFQARIHASIAEHADLLRKLTD